MTPDFPVALVACGFAACMLIFAVAFYRERKSHRRTAIRLTAILADTDSERVRLADTLRQTCLERDRLKKRLKEGQAR